MPLSLDGTEFVLLVVRTLLVCNLRREFLVAKRTEV